MIQLTPEQQNVVDCPVGNILVSAAAGSGKTSVMTDRIVNRIVTGKTDVRSILVMTFTDMAARQMRDKIAEKLKNVLTTATDEATIIHVRRQLLLLPGALISTVHSFCLTVIRNFYYEARSTNGDPLVLPDFTIDDGAESDILLRESIDSLLGDCHEAIDKATGHLESIVLPEELIPHLSADIRGSEFIAAYYRLVDCYGSAKDDESLKELMVTLYRYLRSMPDYAAFVRRIVDEYAQNAADFTHSQAASVLIGQLALRLDRAMTVLPQLETMLDDIRFVADRQKNNAMVLQYRETFACLRTIQNGIANGSMDYNDLYRESRPLALVSAPRSNKTDSPEKQNFMELFNQYVAEAVYTAAGGAGQKKCLDAFQFDPLIVFDRPAAAIEAELQGMLPAIRCLFALILALDTRYAVEKKQAGMIEFSDFEHLALTILRSPEAGVYYRSRMTEIYIDEYQDTSSIQEAIIATITDKNCLMVGDVKQSIYRFRHARPQIFLDKHQAYQNNEGGVLIELNRNFRSQAGIVDTVNQWFEQLMSEAVGEIRYDQRHALIVGAIQEEIESPAVRLLFLNQSDASGTVSQNDFPVESEDIGNDSTETNMDDSGQEQQSTNLIDLNRDQREAIMVASEIRHLIDTGTAFGQIAILARTRQTLSRYAAVFAEFKIPILEEAEKALLDTPMLRLMETLIHLIDNRHQDIPLVAVMRSSLFQGGFSDDELAMIRLAARQNGMNDAYYHETVDWYVQNGEVESLRDRTAAFLHFIDELREKESVLTIGELIDLIFAKTGFRDRSALSPDGREIVADLDLFKGFADRFETRARRGLYAFARYIERLHELERQQPILPIERASQDAVNLLSMHRSKGLEFPVVFIVGTAYQLNIREKNQPVLLSENLGIGPDFVDPDRQIRYPTPLKQAMFETLKAKNRSEELRLLYVAMTRARKTLYLTGCFQIDAEGDTHATQLIQTVRAIADTALPDHLVLAARSYQDWLLLALARNSQADLSPLYGLRTEDPISYPLANGVKIPITLRSLADLEQNQKESMLIAEDSAEPLSDSSVQKSLTEWEQLTEAVVPELTQEEKNVIQQQIQTVILGDYPFPRSVMLPQKMTVSELKRRAEQIADVDEESDGFTAVRGINQTVSEWSAMESKTLSASEIGTAAHQVLRFLELAPMVCNPSREELDRQLNRLREYEILSMEELTSINPYLESLLSFFASPQADRMDQAEKRGQLYREMPFTIAIPASRISQDVKGVAPTDRLMVQGMIDCWFREGEKAILIDFKSDRLSGSTEERETILRNRYRVQIDYYAEAIHLATGLPVAEKLIYSLQDARFISLTDDSGDSLDKGTKAPPRSD